VSSLAPSASVVVVIDEVGATAAIGATDVVLVTAVVVGTAVIGEGGAAAVVVVVVTVFSETFGCVLVRARV